MPPANTNDALRLSFICEAWLYDSLMGSGDRLLAWAVPELDTPSGLLPPVDRILLAMAIPESCAAGGELSIRTLTSRTPAEGDTPPYWQQLYDSWTAGTALQTMARAVEGYDGPTIFAIAARPAGAAAAGVVGAYVAATWRSKGAAVIAEGAAQTSCFLFSIAPTPGAAGGAGGGDGVQPPAERIRWFCQPGAAAISWLQAEAPRGGRAADRGVGFGGSRAQPRLRLAADLCRGAVAVAANDHLAGDLFWWGGSQLSVSFRILFTVRTVDTGEHKAVKWLCYRTDSEIAQTIAKIMQVGAEGRRAGAAGGAVRAAAAAGEDAGSWGDIANIFATLESSR
jgi:hypothetical protein